MKKGYLHKMNIATIALSLVTALTLVAWPSLLQAAVDAAEVEAFETEQGFGPPPQRRAFSGPGRGMRMLDRGKLREELGLTDEQIERLRALRFEGAKKKIQMRSQLSLKRLELRELLQADEPSRTAIDRKLREVSDAQHALLKQRIEQRLAMRTVLTPEQRDQLKELRPRFRRPGRIHRRGGFPGRGPQERSFGPEADFTPEDDQSEPPFLAPILLQ